MSQTILVIENERRTTARIAAALGPLKQKVVNAKDLDEAVNACSKVEPQVVIITADLPQVKVDDAILQLRARAGLRTTPFVVLVPGYEGHDPASDAAAMGAQYVVGEPFEDETLATGVAGLLEAPRAQTVISTDRGAEARESLHHAPDTGPAMTSEDIFGDLLDEAEGDEAVDVSGAVEAVETMDGVEARATAEPVAATEPVPADEPEATTEPVAAQKTGASEKPPPAQPEAPPATPARDAAGDALEATLADVLRAPEKPARPREERRGDSVEELLSKTLSGLEAGGPRRRAAKPQQTVQEAGTREAAPPTAATPRDAGTPVAPAKQPEPVIAGEPFGQYELIDLIATGGMAELYKARMQGVEGFQKIVAIKRILPHLTSNDDFVTMFVDEAKLAAQLQHPNIIHIYDLGKIEQSYYIAMEYIDGKDLRSILRLLRDKGQRMPLGLALHVGARLAAALDYAHRKKDLHGRAMALVHRDVSPQNVLISFDGDIKLCDFGIAKAASKASHTRAGALKGKLQYMSPEQAWGKDLDGRSDIFSLGLVLYEAITGRAAFAGDSELSILEQVRSPRLTPPREIEPSLPEEVERVLQKALQERREDRFQSAGELAEALDSILRVMQPTPSSGDLGAFLADLAAPAPPAQETRGPAPAAERPAPTPKAAAVGAVPSPDAAMPSEDAATAPTPPKRSPVLWLGVAAAVVAAVGIWAVAGRRAGGPQEAPPTPVPAVETTVDQNATQPAVGGAAGVEAAAPPVATIAAPATAAPTRAPLATPTPLPQAVAAVPTVLPTQLPTPTLPTPQPTEAVPTPVPTRTPTAVAAAAPARTSPPQVREGELVGAGPDVIQPQPVSTPMPVYPPTAQQQLIGGVVELDLIVDENGAVQSVSVLNGVRNDINRAAIAAARQWRFKPATKNGVRVKVHYTISMRFRP